MSVIIIYDEVTNTTTAQIEGGKDFLKNLNNFMELIKKEDEKYGN